MNKRQFDKLYEQFMKAGYKRYNQQWHHEDYVIGKGFLKETNQWEEDRCAYQIITSVYDYTDKTWPNLSPDMRDRVGLSIHFDVSRTIDERIEMEMSWYEDTTIKEIEKQAEAYYLWGCLTWSESREEKPKTE